jgi:large subunit ribosomal protein L7/L12
MVVLMLLLLSIGVAFAIGFVVGRATASGTAVRDPASHALAHLPSRPALDDQAFAAHLLVLLAAGQKIEAIKLYREHTGVGLKEAKDAVEALERGT